MGTSQIIQLQSSAALADRIKQTCDINIRACYQCGKCTGGCPVAFAMDVVPRQVIRLLQLGQLDAVLASKAIWLCVSCRACASRCPQGIDMAVLMDTLRHMAAADSTTSASAAERDVRIFHQAFLGGIRGKGRLHELGLILQFNVRSKHFMKDAVNGLRLFVKGKVGILPERTPKAQETAAIFTRVQELEARSHEQ